MRVRFLSGALGLTVSVAACRAPARPGPVVPEGPAATTLTGAGDSTTVDIAGDSMVMRILPPVAVRVVPDEPDSADATDPLTVDAPRHARPPRWWPPSAERRPTGAPGSSYWQQRADYTITATLDTATHRISGHVTLRYTNRSPDTLDVLWLQLEQNLFRPDSRGAHAFGAGARWRGADSDSGGITLGELTIDGRRASVDIDDTRARVMLPAPLVPRDGRLTLDVDFSFRVPVHGADRMGRDGALYYIAQWYPRVAVYDDVRGWNAEPYLGQGEFYLEYGDFDYALTVPAGFVVGGSGVLRNADSVLTPVQRARLARARADSGTTAIITAAEAHQAAVTAVTGTRTWRFSARDVRDVAWAAAPDFRWDAGHWGDVLLQALYPVGRSGRTWEHAVAYTRWTLAAYSALLDAPYPWPQATSVATTAGGMEYPMFVVNDYGSDDPTSIFEVNDHEHGHEWFPMLVGSNERQFAWMDEGINSYLNLFTLERFFPSRDVWGEYVDAWRMTAGTAGDVPLMTPADAVPEDALATIAYYKPAVVLLVLREEVLGAARFDRALQTYVRRWRGRHPTPWDFFRTIEDAAGASLDWFWDAFFHGTATIDVGLDDVRGPVVVRGEGGARRPVAQLTLRRHGAARVPVSLALSVTTTAGQSRTVTWRMPVDGWARAEGAVLTVEVPLAADDAAVVGARLWPDGVMPDLDATNDTWGAPPSLTPRRPVSAGGAASAIPRPPRPGVNP